MIPVTRTAMPITTRDGYGDAVAVTDLTARLAADQAAREREVAEARAAELTASEARLRAILGAAHDGVLSIDQHARITYANTSAERIFGYRADELIGQCRSDRAAVAARGAPGRFFPLHDHWGIAHPGPPD